MEADLAALLRRYRAAAQLTQEELAARSGVSVQAISALERGSRRHPQQKTLGQLATALKLSESQFGALVRAASRGGPPPGGQGDRPRELPADVSLLVGREELLIDAEALLTAQSGAAGAPAKLCLYGAAGMGKSALAVRIGHRVTPSYPDGQLIARLQTVDGEAVPARTTLGRLLRSLGVPADRVPDREDERSALFRSQVADRAVLVVLDDAVDVAQVRPLIPAGSRCAVVITSRRPLLGLEDAEHRELAPLSDKLSRQLLIELGRGALADGKESSLAAIVRHCVGVPLALRIIGLQLALPGGTDVDGVAAALADDAQRLDTLVAGDLAVRTSLDLALATADARARTLFERLALTGVDEFSPWVAAPLLDCDEATGEGAVEALADLGMVQLRKLSPRPRYGMHGLLRSYSVEKLAGHGSDVTQAARRRYLSAVAGLVARADQAIPHGAVHADDLGDPDDLRLPMAEQDVDRDPIAWLDAEVSVVAAAVGVALQADVETAAHLALRLSGYLSVRGDRELRNRILTVARDAVAGSDNGDLEARLDDALFGALAQESAAPADVQSQAERALRSARRSGSVRREAVALHRVAWAAHNVYDIQRAVDVFHAIMDLIDANAELEDRREPALVELAAVWRDVGDPQEAVALLRPVIEREREPTRPHAIHLVMLAEALSDLQEGNDAQSAINEARPIVIDVGDELGLAHVDAVDARVAVLRGDPDAARRLIAAADDVLAKRPDEEGTARARLAEFELMRYLDRPADALRVVLNALEDAVAHGHRIGEEMFRRILARTQ